MKVNNIKRSPHLKKDELVFGFQFVNKNILILSPQDWGDVFVSKHHYASELSKKNKVWFLNSAGQKKLYKIVSVNKISENISVIDYSYLFYGLNKIPFFIVSFVNFFLSKIIKHKIGKIDVVWSFEQTRFFNLNHFNATLKVFHPVDYIPGYPNFEKKIADSADMLISVSQEILNSIVTQRPKYLVNHGLSIPELPSNKYYSSININENKVNIAYVGTINHGHMDRKNFIEIVKKNNHCDFHLIGPVEVPGDRSSNSYKMFFAKISSFSNVYFHGVLPQTLLFPLLSQFDILITCYDWKNNPIRISNSHKILEYLYIGKVTITNYFSAYEGISDEILIMLRNNEEIPLKILEVSKNLEFYNSKSLFVKRREFALQFTYPRNIQKIEEIITNTLNV